MNATVLIELGQQRHTWIDAADLPLLAGRRWWPQRAARQGNWYAMGSRGSLHGTLMGFPSWMHVDHINGDGLDNRRCNLRVVTQMENARNRHYGAAPLGTLWLPPGVPIIALPPSRSRPEVRAQWVQDALQLALAA